METVELIDRLEMLFGQWGYVIVFGTSLVESSPFGWITPGGHVLATAGFFANGGRLILSYVIGVGVVGTWLTLLLGYVLGNKTGGKVAALLNQEKRMRKVQRILKRRGWAVMTASLTSNVTRFWMSYVAGMQGYKFKIFAFYSGVASITWVIVWSVVGFLAGGERRNLESALARLGVFAWVLFAAAVVSIYWATKRGYEEEIDEDSGN